MVCKSKEVRLRILERKLTTVPLRHTPRKINISFSSIGGKSTIRDMLLLWCQAAPRIREVWKNDDDDESNEDGDRTLNYVQPLPCIEASSSC